MADLTRHSKFLSLILRHQPEAAGITLDRQGWAEVAPLLAGMQKAGHPVTQDMLEEIVRTDEKMRYSFNEDHSKIRANQGHSVHVELGLTRKAPPEFLWHGTAERFLVSILAEGLRPMSRQQVHLSADRETARKVGQRHGKPVILRVRAGDMHRDGAYFYQAENGVWLTDNVPAVYLERTE